jgi:hypothetical protein
MKDLEKWVGKKLIVVGGVIDPEDARASIGITDDGREFYAIAANVIGTLTNFRHESAIRSEVIDRMDRMVSSMEKDRRRKVLLPVTMRAGDGINNFRSLLLNLPDAAPLPVVKGFHGMLRSFFNSYEWERNRDKRRSRVKTTPAPPIAAEWFEARLKLPSADFLADLGDYQQG